MTRQPVYLSHQVARPGAMAAGWQRLSGTRAVNHETRIADIVRYDVRPVTGRSRSQLVLTPTGATAPLSSRVSLTADDQKIDLYEFSTRLAEQHAGDF